MLHSIPVVAPAAPCFTLGRAARGRFTVGYAAFGADRPLAHRLLPLNVPVLILDFDRGDALLTGPRARSSLAGPTTWGRGVSVGLTLLGAAAVGHMPLSEISGQSVAVDLPWSHQLAAMPSWAARFAWLDAVFGATPSRSSPRPRGSATSPGDPAAPMAGALRAGPVAAAGPAGAVGRALRGGPVVGGGSLPVAGRSAEWCPSARVTEAWRRLQHTPGARVSDVAAALGLTRRRLERDFRREIGLPPGAVARTARLQRSLTALLRGAPPAPAAAAGGFADQPHLTRTMRDVVGLTPAAFRAFVQDVAPRDSLPSGP